MSDEEKLLWTAKQYFKFVCPECDGVCDGCPIFVVMDKHLNSTEE